MNIPDESLKGSRILIIDNDPENVALVEAALCGAGFRHVASVQDTRTAKERVEKFNPDLVLLDLEMSHVSGYELLGWLRDNFEQDIFLPVLVFTANNCSKAKKSALALGASDFLTKPGDVTEITLRVKNFLKARKLHVDLKRHNEELDRKVRERTLELNYARMEVLEHLAKASEYRDDETGDHTKRVGELSSRIALELGLEVEEADLIRYASQLHDIGKIGVPDKILLKPGRLTKAEKALMQRHTHIGGRILESSKGTIL